MEFKNQRELRDYIRQSLKKAPKTTINQALTKAVKHREIMDKIANKLSR